MEANIPYMIDGPAKLNEMLDKIQSTSVPEKSRRSTSST